MLGRPLQSRKSSSSSQTTTNSSKTSNHNKALMNSISDNNNIIDPNNNNNNELSKSNNNNSSNNSSSSSLNSINSQPFSSSDSTSITTNSNNNQNNNNHSKIKCSPCSPSILLNPTYMNPPLLNSLNSKDNKKSKKSTMTVLITQYPSSHFLGNKKHLIPTPPLPISSTTFTNNDNNNNPLDNNDLLSITGTFNNSPPHSGDTRSRSSSLTGLELHPAPPLIFPTPPSPTSHATSHSVEDLVEDIGGAPLQSFLSESSSLLRSRTDSVKGKNKLTFAPLPPGRRMFRSNSLTIGVAARASMLSSQGSGSAQPRARYAGPTQPMMWYQPGGQLPDDVYTYKDAARGLNKLWSKVSRKKSNTSSSTSSENGNNSHLNGDLLATEKEGKLNGNSGSEIQHIEETDILEENEDDEEIDHHHEEIQGLGLKGLRLDE